MQLSGTILWYNPRSCQVKTCDHYKREIVNGEKIYNVRYHMNRNILISVIIALNERRQIKVQIATTRAFVSAQILSSQHCSCIMTRQKKIWEETVLLCVLRCVKSCVSLHDWRLWGPQNASILLYLTPARSRARIYIYIYIASAS